MKIVYITEVNLDEHSGVLNKLNQQVESWTENGHEVYVVSIPAVVHQGEQPILLTSEAKKPFVYKNKTAIGLFSKGILNIANKFLSVRAVRKYIDSVNPDVIYLREMVAFPAMIHIFGNYPVVLESNTLLRDELLLNNFRVRSLFRLFQQGLYSRIDGFIGVTNEITETFTKFNKPCITIPNSIYIDLAKRHVAPKNIAPKIVFVGSPGCEWHGIDKYAEMASAFPEYSFFLVGPVLPEINLPNLIQLGFLGKNELDDLYKEIDIAVGTLALHRKNMEQACPLKVREYLSFGIPVIIAYEETDLENQEYILKLSNNNSCIEENQEKIRDFIEKWRGQRIGMERIHPLISTSAKESLRLGFMHEVSS